MKAYLLILTLLISWPASTQISRNLILSIDDVVVDNCNLDITILGEKENGKTDTLNATYCPGELLCNDIDSTQIEAKQYKKFTLVISVTDYNTKEAGGTELYPVLYRIPFYTNWYKTSYMVYSIFNMSLRRNASKYVNSRNDPYLFEFTTPNYSMKLVRKRL
jgi:hypothetical protein